MVFEYTDTEMQRLIDIDEHYAGLLDEIEKEIASETKDSEAYCRTLARWMDLEDQRIAEFSALYAEFEQARFDKLGGDLQAIYADAIDQIEKIIESTYNGQKEVAVEMNASGAFDRLQDENPLIEHGRAAGLIKRGIRLHIEALKADKGLSKQLRDYMYNYLSTSPYIYTDTSRKEETQLTPEDELALIIRRPLTPIKTFGFLNDKVDKAIVSGELVPRETDGQIRMWLGANQAPAGKPEVPVYISMLYEGEGIRTSKRMTAFDTAVYNAVSTLYYYHKQIYGNTPLYTSPEEVWRTMNGITDSRKNPTKKQKDAVIASMDKMLFIALYMNISYEIQANYITINDDRVIDGEIKTYLLKGDRRKFKTVKGKIIDGYKIDNEPILYSYNIAKNHVLFVSFDLIDTSDKTGNEGYTVEFRNYLLPQIEMMKNGTRKSKRILYSTLYKDAAIPAPADRLRPQDYASDHSYKNAVYQEAKNDREKISALLESWQDKGYIKTFKPVMKGRAYAGVDIQLPPQKKQIAEKK